MSRSTFTPDYYDRLGLEPSVDTRQLRRQYRLLARLFHPDVSTASDARQRFQALQEAYSVLSSRAARDEYDRWLEEEESRTVRPLRLATIQWPQTLSRPSGPQRVYLMLDVSARHKSPQRIPLNVVLVLDRSSSMKGRRLHYVKAAARRIVDNLSDQDIFGIVIFNDRGTVVLPTGPASDHTVARSAIDSIEATGGTELASGLKLGVQETLKYHSPNVLSHVILLTDGRTYGDEEFALDIAAKAAQENIGITAMGLGTDWNDAFLDELAQRAGGSAHYIAQPDQAVTLFQSEIQQLQRTFARGAQLTLMLDEGVELLQAHEVAPGLRPLTIKDDTVVVLGALPASPPLRALLEFKVNLPTRDVALLGQLTLKAQLIQDGLFYSTERLAVVDVSSDEVEAPPEEIFLAAQRVATLRLQNRTWEDVAQIEAADTAAALEYLSNRFLELGAHDLALATQQEMEVFQKTGTLTESGRMAIKYGTRMLALPAPGEGGA